ncbi:MAG: hypothetical protein J6Y28_02000 [Acholeplasmatales bacterium]|nr:hypothetical protein [Acholeplasmatales bacterium]
MFNSKIIKYENNKNNFQSRKQYENCIFNMLKVKKIVKVKKDLYALINPLTNNIYANKYEIASSISESSYVSYHSALEYYGLTNQVFTNITVSSLSRFRDFEYEGINYSLKLTNDDFMVKKVDEIRITSLEKTIIDCIDRIDLAGGIEELLEALDLLEYVDEEELIKALEHYNKKILFRKTGYLLSFYKEEFNLTNKLFDLCAKYVNSNKFYFLEDEYSDLKIDKKWNLFVPNNLFSLKDGGLVDELY